MYKTDRPPLKGGGGEFIMNGFITKGILSGYFFGGDKKTAEMSMVKTEQINFKEFWLELNGFFKELSLVVLDKFQ